MAAQKRKWEKGVGNGQESGYKAGYNRQSYTEKAEKKIKTSHVQTSSPESRKIVILTLVVPWNR